MAKTLKEFLYNSDYSYQIAIQFGKRWYDDSYFATLQDRDGETYCVASKPMTSRGSSIIDAINKLELLYEASI